MDPNKIQAGDHVRVNGTDPRLYLVRATRNYHETRVRDVLQHLPVKSYEIRLADDAAHAEGDYAYRWVVRAALTKVVRP